MRTHNKKRLFWLTILALVVLALLAACGGGNEEPTATPAPAPTEAAPAEAPAAEAPAAEASGGAGAMTVTVESGRVLADVVGEKDVPGAALSPDGAQLAWFQQVGKGQDKTGSICLYTFETAAKKCYDMAAGAFADYPYQLQWSPDSKLLTFTENPIQLGNEPDIWLFNAADGSFTDLIDDGVTGSWRDAGASALIDYVPAWNAKDGQIYFWRVTPTAPQVFTTAIYRISPAGGEAELVRQLSPTVPGLPVFDQEVFYMDGMSAVAPDGSKMAFLASNLNEDGMITPNLWVIDLADAQAAPVELMTYEAMQAAIPTWSTYPGVPAGLSWTGDSKGIVVTAATSTYSQAPFTVFYYVDVASAAATPVVDFSAVADQEAYFSTPTASGLPMRAYSPWSGSLSPKNDKLLMLNSLGDSTVLTFSPLPPDGQLPVLSDAIDQSQMSTVTRSSRSVDGKVALYGLLLNVKE